LELVVVAIPVVVGVEGVVGLVGLVGLVGEVGLVGLVGVTGATTAVVALPVKEAVVLSVAVTLWVPAVAKVTWKVATPLAKVTVAGSVALVSDEARFAVPS
jgi:hypothetical protein